MADNPPIILAIDQGSGSTKALAIDVSGKVVAQAEVKTILKSSGEKYKNLRDRNNE